MKPCDVWIDQHGNLQLNEKPSTVDDVIAACANGSRYYTGRIVLRASGALNFGAYEDIRKKFEAAGFQIMKVMPVGKSA